MNPGGAMFKDVLRDVVERTDGGIAGLLMGFDGIPVENYVKGDLPVDVETVGMEYSVILTQIMKAAKMLEAGEAREVSIQAENLTTVIRLLNTEYFVALTLTPHGNIGKGRFLLRTLTPKLLDDLI
jgi:predicted regulator of Ras-like GTPase activity (Roadblock/LC7/MglB family)